VPLPLDLTFHKVLELPPALVPDGVYFVRLDADKMRLVVTAMDGTPLDLVAAGVRFSQVFGVAAQWVVNHNLGAVPAAVTLLTVGGVEIEANIVHTSDNQFVVDLNPAIGGQVIVQ
jgi:hypothetical protein